MNPRTRGRFGAWTICGHVIHCETKAPIGCVRVRAFDVDWLQDDALGEDVTEGAGHFRIDYSVADFAKTIFSVPGEQFGTATNGFVIGNLADCAYIITLSVSPLLTTGNSSPNPVYDQIGFWQEAAFLDDGTGLSWLPLGAVPFAGSVPNITFGLHADC